MPCTSGLFQVFDIWTAWFAIKSHWPHSPIWMHICANTVKVCVRCNVCGTRCCKCIGATSGFMAHFEIVSIYNHSMTILNKNGNTYNVACGLYVIILVIAIWNVFFFLINTRQKCCVYVQLFCECDVYKDIRANSILVFKLIYNWINL